MEVTSLQLRNFRNYEELTLRPEPGLNIFLGPNAQGKTNIIEAIYYAALARSHRTSKDGELILWEAQGTAMRLSFLRLGVKNQLDFLLPRGSRRKISLNGNPIRPKELVGQFNAVLFSPEDLYLVKGPPGGRRRFLDSEISQASPAYYHELSRYSKIIVQRNALLKSIRERRAGREHLEMWDMQLAESAAHLTAKRFQSVRRLSMLAKLCQRRISGALENLEIAYEMHRHGDDDGPLPEARDPGAMLQPLRNWYAERLEKYREQDILRCATGLGPHRDDLKISVNGVDLRSYGSQGQQRTGALSLKLAELEFLKSETGEYPVLLLDDVMSELDKDRRQELLAFLQKEKIQTIITATDRAYFPEKSPGAYYEVRAGKVCKS